jgi:hypothetical protein
VKQQSIFAYVLIAAAAACYGLCLWLPAIVYEPYAARPDYASVSPAEAVAALRRGSTCHDNFGVVTLSGTDRIASHTALGKPGNDVDPASLDCVIWPPVLAHGDTGLAVLATGWFGVFTANFAWFANLVLLAAFPLAVMGNRPRLAAYICGGGFLLGLDAFWFDRKLLDDLGFTATVSHLASGFYVWESVFLLLVLSQAFALWRPAPPPQA